SFLYFYYPPPTEIYTLSLHDALPISGPLHDGVVAGLERLVDPQSDPGPREDRFGENRPRQEMADLKSDDRHDGQERVPKRVAQDHRPLRQPLRLRRTYELPGQHLEHAGARHASDDRPG